MAGWGRHKKQEFPLDLMLPEIGAVLVGFFVGGTVTFCVCLEKIIKWLCLFIRVMFSEVDTLSLYPAE